MSKVQWQWQILRAGSFRLDGGSMFGIIPKALWSRHTQSDELNRIVLQTNCVLLSDGDRTVLIESGYGRDWNAKLRSIYGMEERWIGDALSEVGVDTDDIAHVFLSHLHFDHGGGVTDRGADGQSRPTFANARIHVQQTEWDDALANKTTMRGTYLSENLEPIASSIDLADGAGEPIEGIRVMPMVGHTWGQQAIVFDDEHGSVAFCGDVLPTADHVDSAYNMAFDMLPYENMLTKRRLFEQCVTDDWRLILPHESGDPVVRVKRDSHEGRVKYSLHAVER